MATTSDNQSIDPQKSPSPANVDTGTQEQINETKGHSQQDLHTYPPLPRVIMITMALYLAIFLVALVCLLEIPLLCITSNTDNQRIERSLQRPFRASQIPSTPSATSVGTAVPTCSHAAHSSWSSAGSIHSTPQNGSS